MVIQVKGYLTFRPLLPGRRLELPEQGATLRFVLDALAQELGEDFQAGIYDAAHGSLQPSVILLVNGRHAAHLPSGLDTALQDGDQIAIFPPIAGG